MLWELKFIFNSTGNVAYYYMPDRLHDSDVEDCSSRIQDSQHIYGHLFISFVIVLKVFVSLRGKAWVQSVLSVLLWHRG